MSQRSSYCNSPDGSGRSKICQKCRFADICINGRLRPGDTTREGRVRWKARVRILRGLLEEERQENAAHREKHRKQLILTGIALLSFGLMTVAVGLFRDTSNVNYYLILGWLLIAAGCRIAFNHIWKGEFYIWATLAATIIFGILAI